MKRKMTALSTQASFATPAIMKRVLPVLLCLFTILTVLAPSCISAAPPDPGAASFGIVKDMDVATSETAKEPTDKKTVRVGWYESRLCSMDRFGRRSGYAYEYQQKIAAYTGWNYEYVNGSWPELLRMLQRGEIDLLSDVSYTEERAERVLYSALPMGEEVYYAFITELNRDIKPDNYITLNGKKVGVNKNSVQAKFFADWAKKNGVTADIVELTCSGAESRQMLQRGDLDAYVTYDAQGERGRYIPVCKVGSSSIYFAVSKSRPDLAKELDAAMHQIQDENPYYNQQLFERYVRSAGSSMYLSTGERMWLSLHGKIRIGYRDDYLPFCTKDKKTGELDGALKKYLDFASNCTRNAKIQFEPVAFPAMEDGLKALQNGEIDCLFPINLSSHDGEKLGILITEPPLRAELYAVVREDRRHSIDINSPLTVAIAKWSFNLDTFIKDNFPKWESRRYKSYEEDLEAVGRNEVDCMLLSNYRVNKFADLIGKYKLTTLNTGADMRMALAVKRDQHYLYSILSKTVRLFPASNANAALAAYTYEDKDVTLMEFVEDNLAAFLAVIALTTVAFLLLVLRNVKAEKKALERQKLIAVAENDDLTGLFTRSFFIEYVKRFRKDYPKWNMDAIVLDIEQFHLVNELNGKAFGDSVLHALGEEIQSFLKEAGGIASRLEADRFGIYCKHVENYQGLLDRFQQKLNELSRNASIRLRMGVMPWQEGLEPAQAFERAGSACNMMRGKDTHLMIYNEAIRNRENYQQRLLNDLRRAVEDREFKVYYQPKYNIQTEPPRLSSAEALVRWQHPELGLIPPNDFIPLFEGNGQIRIIDKYVWTETARQIAEWKKKYGVAIPVSVNLSRVDIFDPMLVDVLDGLIQDNCLERSLLKLEVTESACIENTEELTKILKRLRDKGYRIEMDDFGSGYSSLNMLSSMPVDVLKMDRGFILNIEHSEQDFRLVELILDIARNLKMPVIAEGVETEKQMSLLKDAGCDLVQGYYFSRPLPPEQFEERFLKEK